MKTISIINLKGGVGKTTTAVTMAQLLAHQGKKGNIRKRVLLFDNDKQGNTSRLFNLYNGQTEAPACQVLKTGDITGAIRHTKFKCIDVIPCNYFMELAELQLKADTENPQHARYRKALEAVKDKYDYCIIDNPPDLGLNVINALVATDEIIIPVNLDCYALDGLEELVDQVNKIKILNQKATLAGCLITNFEKADTSEAAEIWLRTKSGFPVYAQKIRHSKKVSDSTFYKQTPIDYSIRCGASQDYKKFVNEYIAKTAEREV